MSDAAKKQLPDQLPLQERHLQISAEDCRMVKGDDGHYRFSFPVSSETPVNRWYGDEVLSHEASAIRVDRLSRGAVMHLFNHNTDDPRGVVEGYRVQGKRLWVDVKLFKTAKAEELATMIDGGFRNVSLLYAIHVTEEDVKKHRYTHTDWEPYEVSSVTIPADATVGIGRSQERSGQFALRKVVIADESSEQESIQQPTAQPAEIRSTAVENNTTAAAGANAEQQAAQQAAQVAARAAGGGAPPTGSALALENGRRQAIVNLCQANGIADNIRDLWVTSGADLETVSSEMLAIMQKRGEATPKSPAMLGLSAAEANRFSMRKAVQAIADNTWTAASFEAECSREIAKKIGRTPEPNKFFVPYEVQQRQNETQIEMLARMLMKRDLLVAGSAGVLVETSNWSFVEILRNITALYAMGVTRLTGLSGNVAIPKQSTAATPYWLGTEQTAITESQPGFVQINMSPKSIGGYTEVSRQLLIQSNPSAEGLIMADLAAVIGIEIDRVGLNGSGTAGQPLGILNTSGIGSVTGTSMDYADIVEFQTDTATGNALFDGAGYLTTPAVAGLFKTRVKFANTASPIWEGKLTNGVVDGYRAMSTNNMPAASMLFGDFSKTVIAEWGVIEIEVNPYANFQAGIVGIRAMALVDVAVRYAQAYSAANTIT